jgi:hypothetical protein
MQYSDELRIMPHGSATKAPEHVADNEADV